jgi:hypothetical protein
MLICANKPIATPRDNTRVYSFLRTAAFAKISFRKITAFVVCTVSGANILLAKRKQLDIKFRQMQWLIGTKSELSTENKLLVYKTILKPIWTMAYHYGDLQVHPI